MKDHEMNDTTRTLMEQFTSLLKEWRVEISVDETDSEELRQQGFIKLSKENAARVSSLLRYVPGIASEKITDVAVKQAFDKAVKGTYRVIVDSALHLGQSSKTPGAFSGLAYDAANKLVTHAEWMINDASLDISQAPRIATGIFSAISYVVGQHYMEQINSQLTDITGAVSSVQGFLKDKEESRLDAIIHVQQDIINHITEIMSDKEDVNRTLIRLQDMETTLLELIRTYEKEIERAIKPIAAIDAKKAIGKENAIENVLRSIAADIRIYNSCTRVLFSVKMLIIVLKNVKIEHLDLYCKDLSQIISEYKSTIQKIEKELKLAVKSNTSLRQRAIWQNFPALLAGIGISAGGTAIGGGAAGISTGFRAAREINKSSNEARSQKKAHYVETIESMIGSVGDTVQLEKQLGELDEFVELATQPVEIAMHGDDVYFRAQGSVT